MRKALGLFLVMLALAGAVGLAEPNFLSAGNLANTARQASLYGIMSLGAGIVILMGGIDLSVGSVVGFTGVLFAMGLTEWGWSPLEAWTLTLAACAAIGALQGLLVAGAGMQPFIATLCGLMIVRGAARYMTGDASKGLGTGHRGLGVLVEGSVAGVPVCFLLLLGVAGVAGLLVHGTVAGRHILATGSNEEAARLAGVRVGLLKVVVYALSGLLAGLAGILFLIYTNSAQPATTGVGYELYAIAAAVLGGVSLHGGSGTVLGILVGTAFVRLLVNATELLEVSTYLKYAVVGGAILAGILLDELAPRLRRIGGTP